jgi:hypothetical protein
MNLTIALQEVWAKQPHLILIAGFIILAFLGFGIYSICVKGETLAG